MIKTFHVKNFRSILDATLDFSFAEGKAPNGYASMQRIPFLQEPGTAFRGVPVLALFGANAAGKSNLLKAMDAFRRMAVGTVADNYRFYQPNKLHGPQGSTEMELDFFAKGMHFTYSLEADESRVIHEELTADKVTVFSVRETEANLEPLIKPAYPIENLESIRKVECALTKDGFASRTFLSVLGRNYGGLDARAKAVFDFFQVGVVPSATDNIGMASFPRDVRRLAEARNVDEESVLADIAKIIAKLDVPIAGLSIVRTKGPPPQSLPTDPSFKEWVLQLYKFGGLDNIHLETIHRDEQNRDVVFRLADEESAGTQNLVYLVARMLLALEQGGIMFVDELDKSLHPLLVRSLLNLFLDHDLNKKGARLVFTTHCTDLMDDSILRLSEVGIVANGAKTGTRVRRLAELRADGMDIRNVTDFRRNYLDGFYSGVPYPTL